MNQEVNSYLALRVPVIKCTTIGCFPVVDCGIDAVVVKSSDKSYTVVRTDTSCVNFMGAIASHTCRVGLTTRTDTNSIQFLASVAEACRVVDDAEKNKRDL
jgi:hypothetical protein